MSQFNIATYFADSNIRIAIAIPVAIIVSLSLFLAMEAMIRPGEINLDEDRSITLRNFLADKSNPDIRTRQRKVKKPDDIDKPPPPPKLTANKQRLDIPTPSLEGAAPDRIDVDQLNNIDVGAVAVNDRDAQPIRPPLCQFPQRAASKGLEGSCEVSLNVDIRGRPYAVKAQCTNRLFVREAERCVKKAEFAPKIKRGVSVERRNVVYPVKFTLEK